MPHSYARTMADAMHGFLNMQGIDLLEGDVWGHRKDLDEYVVIEDDTLKEIKNLINQGVASDDIQSKVKAAAKLNPDLIKYIVKIESVA